MESIPITEKADEICDKAGVVKQSWRPGRIGKTGSEGVRGGKVLEMVIYASRTQRTKY